MNPRPYQSKAKADIYENWKDGPIRQLLVMPTGGGKTVTFVDIIKDFLSKGKRVILVAHREELIFQAHNTLYQRKIYSGVIKSGIKPSYHLPCQVASIQTIQNRKVLPNADLVIFDECHHVQSDNGYGRVIKNHFSESYILGVTATPYRLSGLGFSDIFSKLVLSTTFNDLVSTGYLTPYKYFIGSTPDLSSVKMSQGDYVQAEVKKVMEIAPIVESYENHCLGMQGIVFCVNVLHSKETRDKYIEAGYAAAHIDGNTPTEERKRILNQFEKREILILCNVGIATEGTDIPACQFVQLARPTKSLSLFLQMCGRACRTIWDEIKDCNSDEDRVKAVQQGSKPFAFVLDNSGCYKDHGLPDEDRDWEMYFHGWKKQKKKKNPEFIEVFVIEDELGKRRVTKQIGEIDGMTLIEVTKEYRQKVINLKSIKHFDYQFNLGFNLYRKGKIKKPGWFAFYKYKEYCDKNLIVMNDEVWVYLKKRLVDDRRSKKNKIQSEIEELKNESNLLFSDVNKQMIAKLESEIKELPKFGVPSYALELEREKYLQNQIGNT